MNVFILNTGRCGSTTFIAACRHITNFTAGHESRIHLLGPGRLAYPDNHIEADNRLAWLLGRLDTAYGDDARYVHLRRDRERVAASFARRMEFGIMKAYWEGVLLREQAPDALAAAHDYIDTVEANILRFLQDKRYIMPFRLETARDDFPAFWDWIGAAGELDQALAEWDIRHNTSDAP